MNVATTVVILAMVAYAMLLFVFGQENETTLIFWSTNFQIELPFEISPLWNLLVFPIVMFTVSLLMNKDQITGKEYNGSNGKLEINYDTKLNMFMVQVVSLVGFVLVFLTLSFVKVIGAPEAIGGPMSTFTIATSVYFATYIVTGTIYEFFCILFKDFYFGDVKLTETFLMRIEKFVKIGVVKTSPLMFGLILGFMLRFTLNRIARVIAKMPRVRVKVETN